MSRPSLANGWLDKRRFRAGRLRAWQRLLLGVTLMMVFLTGCVADDGVASQQREPAVLPLANVAAVTQLPSGDVIAGDRLSGDLWRFSPEELAPQLVGTIEVLAEGQRGLLGLTSATSSGGDEKLFLAWTNSEGQLLVGSLDTSTLAVSGDLPLSGPDGLNPEVVWSGFESASGANGGHLDVLPDGQLVLGVGTLRNSAAIDDPDLVNGKLLALDPDGGASQRPEVLSSGWKNPFAFDVTDDGEIWVADNEPEDGSAERIGRGDRDDQETLIDLETQFAPGALVALSSGRIGICSYLSGEMREVTLTSGVPSQPGELVATNCRTASLVLADGRLLTSNGETVHIAQIER